MTHRVGWLDPVFVFLSFVGTYGLVWIAIAALVAVVWRRPGVLMLVLASALVSEAVSSGLRAAVGRPRPPLRAPEPEPLVAVPHSGSFPSGHATTSFACATALVFAAPRRSLPFFVLAAAIAFSRIYVGVHYPLDVLGGAALGIGIAIALRTLPATLRRSLSTLRSS